MTALELKCLLTNWKMTEINICKSEKGKNKDIKNMWEQAYRNENYMNVQCSIAWLQIHFSVHTNTHTFAYVRVWVVAVNICAAIAEVTQWVQWVGGHPRSAKSVAVTNTALICTNTYLHTHIQIYKYIWAHVFCYICMHIIQKYANL